MHTYWLGEQSCLALPIKQTKRVSVCTQAAMKPYSWAQTGYKPSKQAPASLHARHTNHTMLHRAQSKRESVIALCVHSETKASVCHSCLMIVNSVCASQTGRALIQAMHGSGMTYVFASGPFLVRGQLPDTFCTLKEVMGLYSVQVAN